MGKRERSVVWIRWDHHRREELGAATYPVLSCVKSRWESRAASGQTEHQRGAPCRQTDNRSRRLILLCVASVTTTNTTCKKFHVLLHVRSNLFCLPLRCSCLHRNSILLTSMSSVLPFPFIVCASQIHFSPSCNDCCPLLIFV